MENGHEWMNAWRGVLQANAQVSRAIERFLLRSHGIPLTWFEVMNRLMLNPQRRMRMQDLSEQVLFTSGGLSRLVDRIEAAGYVKREPSPEDRRGIYVCMTPEGVEEFMKMHQGHARVVEHEFASKLTPADVAALRRALNQFCV